jgi:lipoyl synthase
MVQGFRYVASGPMVRSSYKAGEFYIKAFFCGNFYIKAMIEADRSKTPLQTQVHN